MAKAAPARSPVVVRFLRHSNPNIEGTSASFVSSAKHGRHFGWVIEEDAVGVLLTKGSDVIRVPWSGVQQVEYSNG